MGRTAGEIGELVADTEPEWMVEGVEAAADISSGTGIVVVLPILFAREAAVSSGGEAVAEAVAEAVLEA